MNKNTLNQRRCKVEGCLAKRFAGGFCGFHYHKSRYKPHPKPILLCSLCTLEGCFKQHKAKGYCAKHYARYLAHGDPLVIKTPRKRIRGKCTIEDCSNPHCGHGYCHKHFYRVKNGKPIHSWREVFIKENPPSNGVGLVPLTREQFTKVDESDYHDLMKYYWNAVGYDDRLYARNHKLGLMARFIMSPPGDMFVDHINHDTLDNRRSNLRICTPAQNSQNSMGRPSKSNYKGITYLKGKWQVFVSAYGERHYFGQFDTEELAAMEYAKHAKRLHKEFFCGQK